MIFDSKLIDEITEDEIDALVQKKTGERQHLEFKATIDLKDAEDKLELLHDIASLANGGGGYLIVGIGDDGKGAASGYVPADRLGDPESIKKSIAQLCLDHISERIDGLEVVCRSVKGHPLVIVRVPNSARVPHMVKFERRTDFYSRYHDGKREMTIHEIREAFTHDMIGLRLSAIEAYMYSVSQGLKTEKDRSAIAERIKSGTIPTLSITEDSQVLAEVVMERFEAEVGNTPYFWIAATPGNPRANSVDVDPEEIRSIIMSPPESRRNGWSMDFSQQVPIERFAEGIRRGRKDWRYLELLPNGHMEFWTPLNNIFCWPQSPEEFGKRPRLNPSAVIEYPTTFLRLYRAIIDKANIQDTFAIRLYYRNVKGYRLASYPPYPPGTIAFIDQLLINQSKPFGGQHVASPPMRVASDFSPDGIAYKLIKQVYSYFELEAEVAFFNPAESKFVFP